MTHSINTTQSNSSKAPWFIWVLPGILFVSFFLYAYLGGLRGQSPVDRSLAILPIELQDSEEQMQFWMDGWQSELIDRVGGIRHIKTIARGSVMRYRNPDRDLPAIAQELGIATVLVCRAQMRPDSIRMRAELRDARKDKTIWINIYERELTPANLYTIQQEMIREIAKSLKSLLSPDYKTRLRRVPTFSLEALEAYFLGRQSFADLDPDQRFQAVPFFEEAIAKDPEFADAYGFLALAMAEQWVFQELNESSQIPLIEAIIAKALARDPQSFIAYRALGIVKLYLGEDEAAVGAFRQALELNPNDASSHFQLGVLLNSNTRGSGASFQHLEKAKALDPFTYGPRIEMMKEAGELPAPSE